MDLFSDMKIEAERKLREEREIQECSFAPNSVPPPSKSGTKSLSQRKESNTIIHPERHLPPAPPPTSKIAVRHQMGQRDQQYNDPYAQYNHGLPSPPPPLPPPYDDEEEYDEVRGTNRGASDDMGSYLYEGDDEDMLVGYDAAIMEKMNQYVAEYNVSNSHGNSTSNGTGDGSTGANKSFGKRQTNSQPKSTSTSMYCNPDLPPPSALTYYDDYGGNNDDDDDYAVPHKIVFNDEDMQNHPSFPSAHGIHGSSSLDDTQIESLGSFFSSSTLGSSTTVYASSTYHNGRVPPPIPSAHHSALHNKANTKETIIETSVGITKEKYLAIQSKFDNNVIGT